MNIYFSRDIETKIEEWYHGSFKKILHVDGARQVGKTSTIEHFIRNNYSNVIEINLAKDDYGWLVSALRESTNNFSKIDVPKFTQMIGDKFKYTDDDSTVIFLDEIQVDHVVYNYLRSLNRDLKCDVIISGSYLMMALKEEFFQPVGDFDMITMYPMSFSEFLRTVSFPAYTEYVRWPHEELSSTSLSRIKEFFAAYCKVGGYPEMVKKFVISKSLRGTDIVMESILHTITLDSQLKLDNIVDARVLKNVSESIIKLLIHEKRGSKNVYETLVKNFQDKPSNRLNKTAISKVIAWLLQCHFLETAAKYVLPDISTDYLDERLYFEDIGVLNFYASTRVVNKSDLSGALAENFVFNAMNVHDYRGKFLDISPHFGVYGDGEIDFFAHAKYDEKNYAFEVKAGNEPGKTAIRLFKDKVADKLVYFMGNCKHKIDGDVEIVPLCLAERWFQEFPYPEEEDINPSMIGLMNSF